MDAVDTPAPHEEKALSAIVRRRAQLGAAMDERATELAAEVVAGWRHRRRIPSSDVHAEPGATITAGCVLGTQLLARYLNDGPTVSPTEQAMLANSAAKAVAVLFPWTDMIKNIMLWRDITLSTLTPEARRLGIEASDLLDVVAFVQQLADAALLNFGRGFDEERQQLHARLDAEHAELTHAALHDPLTGVANRALLLDRLSHAFAQTPRDGREVGLVYLDLDGLKDINDTRGHVVGDKVLMAVAQRLEALIDPTDIVARLGGDEFVVLCENLHQGLAQLRGYSERIRAAIAAHPLTTHQIWVTASVGAALATPDSDPERILAHADAEMYAAKNRRTLAPSRLSNPSSTSPTGDTQRGDERVGSRISFMNDDVGIAEEPEDSVDYRR